MNRRQGLDEGLHDETRVPISWVFALLCGCAVSLASMVALGIYAGSLDARAQATSQRVDKLEAAVDALSLIDRRLARIEGKMGVDVPANDRIPASK